MGKFSDLAPSSRSQVGKFSDLAPSPRSQVGKFSDLPPNVDLDLGRPLASVLLTFNKKFDFFRYRFAHAGDRTHEHFRESIFSPTPYPFIHSDLLKNVALFGHLYMPYACE